MKRGTRARKQRHTRDTLKQRESNKNLRAETQIGARYGKGRPQAGMMEELGLDPGFKEGGAAPLLISVQ